MALSTVEFDFDAAEAADAPAQLKLLAKVVEPYNETVRAVENHKKSDNVDELVKKILDEADPESELGQNLAKLARLREAEKVLNAQIQESAREMAQSELDPEFDEGKSRAAVKDSRAAWSNAFKNVLATFEILGHVTVNRTASGAIEDFEPVDEFGEKLQEVASAPNIRVTGNSAPAVESLASKIRTWAKENGMEVNARGKLSDDIQEAYAKAHGLEEVE